MRHVAGLHGRVLRNRRGQSILEFLIMLGVVLLLVIAFARGPFQGAINNVFGSSATVTTGTSDAVNNVNMQQAKNW